MHRYDTATDAPASGLLPPALKTEQLRAVLDCVSDAVLILDPYGNLIHVNHAGRRLLGDGSLEHLRRVLTICASDGSQIPVPQFATDPGHHHGFAHDEILTLLNQATGQRKSVSCTVSVIREDNGKPSLYVASFKDVTPVAELARAEKASRLMAEHKAAEFLALFNALPESMIVVEEPGLVVQMNTAARERFDRMDPDQHNWDVRDSSARIFVTADPHEPPSLRALRGEFVSDFYYTTLEDNHICHRIASTAPLPSADGKRRVLMVSRDVSELYRVKSAEQKARLLAEQRAREWELTVDNAPACICLMDGTGTIRVLNKGAERLSGLRMDHVGKNMKDIDPGIHAYNLDDTRLKPEEYPLTRASNGDTFSNLAYKVEGADGKRYDLLASSSAVDTPMGQRILFISHDVTELRHLERIKQDFMLTINHEIRNPVQVIYGLTQLIRLKIDQESQTRIGKHLDALANQVTYLTNLLEDILTAYRIENSRLSISPQACGLREIVSQVVAQDMAGSGHKWALSGDGDEIPVYADPCRVRQIIANLTSNAKKYTEPGKHISISVYTDATDVFVKVEDEGIGIPEDKLETVFLGFVRAHKPSEWVTGGLGLGLFISRNLARRMDGDLWAERPTEGGTRMVLRLPLLQPQGLAAGGVEH